MSPYELLGWRTDNAINQLQRYGRALESEEMVQVLELLSDLNDDLAHGRDHECVIVPAINKIIDKLKEVK